MKPILAALTAAAFIMIGIGDADAQRAGNVPPVKIETQAPAPTMRVTRTAPKVAVPAARPKVAPRMRTEQPRSGLSYKEANFYWNAFGGADF
jgi:hypothetical protein